IVACYHGFVDAVVVLAECPHVDVNWQDSEGNTALITAAQAGHATITNYLLNYFPGLDLERRNVFGFTALMKAAMQGRTECIRALMLADAGPDCVLLESQRGRESDSWAVLQLEWPLSFRMFVFFQDPLEEEKRKPIKREPGKGGVVLLQENSSRGRPERLTEFVRSSLASRSRQGLEDGGVLDHMVRMTTSLYSPAVAIACRTGPPYCHCPANAEQFRIRPSWFPRLRVTKAPPPHLSARTARSRTPQVEVQGGQGGEEEGGGGGEAARGRRAEGKAGGA
uniref:Uncharacterized protein n=1 Tax=Myotis lucifugus TaxID=59463 RepID=G1Q0I3_MYOLU